MLSEHAPDKAGERPLVARLLQITRSLATWIITTIVGTIAAILLTVFGVGSLIPGFVVAAGVTGVLFFRDRLQRGFAIGLALCVALILWRSSLRPSHDRDWEEHVAVLPEITLRGDEITIDGVRNFRWQEDGNVAEALWERRTYRLADLQGIEMILEPFPYTALMAHTMLSFDFGGGGRIVLTIEARLSEGESYGPVVGGLNQFELIYLFVDERDAFVPRARAGHELYAFPVVIDPLRLRAFFLGLCATANNLRVQPSFYHIIRDNCTTSWIQHSDHLSIRPVGLQLESVLNGRIGRLLHRRGAMDTTLPYDEAKALFRIDGKVLEHRNAPDFPNRIRENRGG